MRLVDLVRQETGAGFEQIVLLRHSSGRTQKLLALGGRIAEDYTFIQPTGSQYDYVAHGDHVVAVIVDDCLYGVYRVLGVDKEGTSYRLGSKAYRQLQIDCGQPERPARRYKMEVINSAANGQVVSGWEGAQRTPVQREGGKRFWKIEVTPRKKPHARAENLGTEGEMETAVRENRLRFGNVPTSNCEATRRQRVGQDVVRKHSLECYGRRCAICDVSDERLLRASHIKGWAECEQSRGDLSNVICLCGFHDALFENGYWSLGDQLEMVIRRDISSETIRRLLPVGRSFRKPAEYPPGLEFIRYHRSKHGLSTP